MRNEGPADNLEALLAERAVKVPRSPASLERRLADLGWRIGAEQMPGPFFCGAGPRA